MSDRNWEPLLASPEFRRAACGWEAAARVPREAALRLADAGLLGALVPAEHGGHGPELADLVRVHSVLAAASASLQNLLTVHGMTTYAIARWGQDRLRAELLPDLAAGRALAGFALTEEAAGSDIGAVVTRIAPDGDGAVVDGHKRWVSFGQLADEFLVFGKRDGLGLAVLVPRSAAGVEVRPCRPTTGLRAAMLADVTFTGVRVGGHRVVGRPGFGLTHLATSCLTLGRLFVAAGAVGVAAAALRHAVRYAATREQAGARLGDHQLVQGLLARPAVQVDAARAFLADAAAAVQRGDPDGPIRAVHVKLAAVRAAVEATRNAAQVLGARGLDEGHPVARYLRDVKVYEVIEGSTEVLLGATAVDLIRRSTAPEESR